MAESYEGAGAETLALLIALPVFIGPGIVGWQIIHWLQTAKWMPLSIADALTYFDVPLPRFNWLGFQKITDSLLDLPLSLTAFLVWILAFVCILAVIEEQRKKRA
jgi:hypothetical protein